MRSYTRNLLISSALVLSSFSNMAVGSETLTITDIEGSRVVRQQANPVCGNMPASVTRDDLKAWGIRPSDSLVTSFFKSLFGPFIQDAPKALEAVTAQKEKLAKEGVVEYASTVGSAVGEAIIENPLDAIILGGAMALGFTDAEYASLIQMSMATASGLKNSQALCAFAHSLGKDKERLQFVLYSAAALYALQSLTPVAGALLTPEIGETFQLNKNAVSNSPVVVAGLTNGNFAGVWADSNTPPNLIGRIFFANGTATSNEFTVNTQPASTGFDVAGLSGGKFIVTWEDQVPAIIARIFKASGGAATNPFKVNQVANSGLGALPSVAGLKDGNAFITWGAVDTSGDSNIPARIFSSTGTAVTDEFNINQAPGIQVVNPSIMGLVDGNALAAWYTPGGFLGRIVFPNATFGGSEFKINQTALSGNSDIGGAGLTDGKAFLAYQTSSGIVGRIIQNGVPSGNEFPIGTGVGYASYVASLTDGNALVMWPTTNVQEKLFDSTGTPLSNQFAISGSNNGGFVSVSGLSNGGAVVAWGNATAVYGSEVSFPLPPTPTPTPTPTVAPTPTPKVAPTPTPSSSAGSASPSWFTTSVTSLVAAYYAWAHNG